MAIVGHFRVEVGERVDEVGSVVRVSGVVRLVVFVAVFTLVPAMGVSAVDGFSDVPDDVFYTEPVAWLVDQGITQGTGPSTFSPGATVTRAQMAAFVWRFGFEKGGVSHGFSDVASGVYYDDAVGWLLLHQITTGTSATTYSPSQGVTRAQMAVFLWRYAGKPVPSSPATFSDVPAGIWFSDAVSWLVEQGITQGTSPTTFSPDAMVTRAQMATFLWRFAGEPAVGSLGVNRDPSLYDCGLQTSIPTIECEALVAVSSVNPGATLTGWITEPDPATWSGVTVAGGVVTDLDVGSKQITEVPPEIGNLTNLIFLNLTGNQLTAMPAEIGNLTGLELLFLGGNQFTAVPAEIGNLTNLTALGLDGNQLTAVPSEIWNLTELTGLGLSGNQLTAVPSQIGNLTKLTGLALDRNQLTAVPSEIWNLTGLTDLGLSGNQLTTLPAEIGNLTNLEAFFVGNNQLTEVPGEIWNLTNLAALGLSGSQLTTLPAEIGNFTNLIFLDISNNQLTTLPAGIGNLTNLTDLVLSNNQLTTLPAGIGNLTNLEFLLLYDNQLASVPIEMMNLTNLSILGISGQSVCLSVADTGFAAWLAGFDASWNDGCP